MGEVSPLVRPVEVLSQTEFFADLDRRRLETLASAGRIEEYAEGVAIYENGQAARCFYVLAEGVVQFRIGFGSRTSAGDMLRRGNVFGWAALTPSVRQRIATATCITPCTVLALDGAQCLAHMRADHTLGFHLMTRLNQLVTGTLTAFVAG